jgi:LemA protein
MNTTLIILAIVVLVIVYAIGLYNGLVQKNVRVDEAWSDIDVQLKRRYDLIPNLVETVKGYAKHEEGVFTAVVEARSKASSMSFDIANASHEQMQAFATAQEGLSGSLGKLFALAEAYPDLKANENFLELQREIRDTEDKIQASRRFYNGTVRDLNTSVQQFPGNIFAQTFGFLQREFYDLESAPQERENIKITF